MGGMAWKYPGLPTCHPVSYIVFEKRKKILSNIIV